MPTNKVTLTGKIQDQQIDEVVLNKDTNLTRYTFKLESPRLSGSNDIIPIVFYTTSQLIINKEEPIYIEGYIVSRNAKIDNKSKLLVEVGAKIIRQATEEDKINNKVEIEGFIVKQPIYRETPMHRQISDILLAVNHNQKSSYIPTIVWGRNAKYISTMPVGTKVRLKGRFQSRLYTKLVNDIEELRTAYELSVIDILETEKPTQE